jgi:hypothetical protein
VGERRVDADRLAGGAGREPPPRRLEDLAQLVTALGESGEGALDPEPLAAREAVPGHRVRHASGDGARLGRRRVDEAEREIVGSTSPGIGGAQRRAQEATQVQRAARRGRPRASTKAG